MAIVPLDFDRELSKYDQARAEVDRLTKALEDAKAVLAEAKTRLRAAALASGEDEEASEEPPESLADEVALTPAERETLEGFEPGETLTISEVEKGLEITYAAAVQRLSALVKRGLLVRVRSGGYQLPQREVDTQ